MEDQPTDASTAQTNGGIAPPATAASGVRGTSRRSLLKLLGAGAVGAAVGAGVTLVGGDALRPGATSSSVVATPTALLQ